MFTVPISIWYPQIIQQLNHSCISLSENTVRFHNFTECSWHEFQNFLRNSFISVTERVRRCNTDRRLATPVLIIFVFSTSNPTNIHFLPKFQAALFIFWPVTTATNPHTYRHRLLSFIFKHTFCVFNLNYLFTLNF